VFAFLFTLPGAHAADAVKPAQPDSSTSEQWYSTYLNNAKSGYHHFKVTQVKEGDKELCKIESDSKSRLDRGGDVMETIETSVFFETADGAPVRFEQRTKEGKDEKVLKGEMRDGKLVLTTDNGQSVEVPWEKGAVLSLTNHGPFEKTKIEAGAKVTRKEYLLEFRRFVNMEYSVEKKEKVKVGDKEMELFRVSAKCPEIPYISATVWINEDGDEVKGETKIGPLSLTEILTDKETALKEEKGARMPALTGLVVKCKQDFYHPFLSNSVLYKINIRNNKPEDMPLQFDNQKVEKTGKDLVLLRAKAVIPADAQIQQLPMKLGPEMDEFLKPNEYMESNYDKIVEQAKKLAADEKDSYKVAKVMEKWVFKYIKDKNYTVGFASAKQVFDNPAGDCSEHAVLLAAMLRAAGIPSRFVTGVVYEPGEGFIWHAWDEAYVGVWVPLDATLPAAFVDCSHIVVSKDSLAKRGPADPTMALLQCAGNMDVELLEYTYLSTDGDKQVEKKGFIGDLVERNKNTFVFKGYGVTVAIDEKYVVNAVGSVLAVKDNGRRLNVKVGAFPPAQAYLLRAALKKGTARFEKLDIPNAKGVIAHLLAGGRFVIIMKDDCLITISYSQKSADLDNICDEIIKTLKFE
jgi:hypothetical protein